MQSVVFVVVVLFAGSVSPHNLKFHICSKKGIECLNQNTYVSCPKSSSFVIEQFHSKKCPQGYVCQEEGPRWYPCVPESDIDNDSDDDQQNTIVEVTSSAPKEFHFCNKKGIQCLDKNTFVFCPRPSRFAIKHFQGKKCPQGYVCKEQEFKGYPCVLEPDVDNDEELENNEQSTDVPSNAPKETTTESQKESSKTTVEEGKSESSQDHVVTSKPTSSTTDEDITSNTQSQEDATWLVTESATDIEIVETSTVNTIEDATEIEKQSEENSEEEVSESTTRTIEITTSISEDDVETSSSEDDVETNTDESEVGTTEDDVGYSSSEESLPELVKTSTSKVDPAGLIEHSWNLNRPDPPECSNSGVLPGPNCHEYYECVPYFWFFYRLQLQICPEGESFSIAESRCVPSAENDCVDYYSLPIVVK